MQVSTHLTQQNKNYIAVIICKSRGDYPLLFFTIRIVKRNIKKVITILATDIGVPGIFTAVANVQHVVSIICITDKNSLNFVSLSFYVYVLVVLNYKFDGSAVFFFFFCPSRENLIRYLSY